MSNFKQIFKDKKITVIGLGLLGRASGDTAFFAEYGADLIVTDLKTSEQLKDSLKKLEKYKNIKYVLGEHRLEDFRGRDFILKTAGVPIDSLYIQEAEKNNIPVEMSAELLVRHSGLPTVAVTGTRGKSTVTHLISHILKSANKKIILGGNVRGVSNLQLLKEVQGKDFLVLELDSWQLQGFGAKKISPNVSVFTTFFPDHMNYYKGSMEKYFADKANIFKFQHKKDLLVVGSQAMPFVSEWGGEIKSEVVTPEGVLPEGWKFNLPGAHNEYNAMLAVEVARHLGIPDEKIKKALNDFESLSGRLQFLREVNGIKIYNDNSSTTPDATIAALKAVGDITERKVILVFGGDNKFLYMSALISEIPKFCSKVILFKERGTDLIRDKVFELNKKGVEVYEEEGLENTIKRAFQVAKSGETILYSPAFSSFGKYFTNEYDRGDQFVKIVESLK
ncbi:MAG: UDP-N-acetylmuramoyl-L-alanine--D-glutamate ligase [bacterium]